MFKKSLIYMSGIIIFIIIIFFGLSFYIDYKIDYIEVYVANKEINQRECIGYDDLKITTVPSGYVSDCYLDASEIVGKYVKLNAYIPEGSFFYFDFIEDNPTDVFVLSLDDEEVAYDLLLREIKANPGYLKNGMSCDLYLTIIKEDIISDLFISNVKIVGLYDSSYKESKDNNIAIITISLKREYIAYLNKALKTGEISIVVSSQTYNENKSILNKNSDLMNYLN